MTGLSNLARVLVTAVAAIILLGTAVTYALVARDAREVHASGGPVRLDDRGRLLVVADRQLATVAADDPDGPRSVSTVQCVRAYAASGTGICLRQDSAWSYSLHVLDADLGERLSFPLRGLPNRARVSASGRMVAWTSFISGESYNKGGFSTRTGIVDTETGTRVTSLESFAVTRDGRPYSAVDLNFWGVTFTDDDNRFYATMSTDGHRYLVEADFAARTVRTLATNVECPSLSPDGTRIAFKQAVDDDPVKGWRLSVLDLPTMAVTNLAETRSVDDQPAWLDEATVAYTLRDGSGTPTVWATDADGGGEPQRIVTGVESPAALP